MKTISTLIVMAFLCLILTPAFAGIHLSSTHPKDGTWKATRLKVKLPHSDTYCFATVYTHTNGIVEQGGAYGYSVNTYIELEDQNNEAVVADNNVQFILYVTIGPVGTTYTTPITYNITSGSAYSAIVSDVFVQRSVSESDYAGFESTPTTTSGYDISISGYSPINY